MYILTFYTHYMRNKLLPCFTRLHTLSLYPIALLQTPYTSLNPIPYIMTSQPLLSTNPICISIPLATNFLWIVINYFSNRSLSLIETSLFGSITIYIDKSLSNPLVDRSPSPSLHIIPYSNIMIYYLPLILPHILVNVILDDDESQFDI